jgi:NO-binding membrane sensor protein with MHYT domain
MKAYVWTTGAIFILVTLAHFARMVSETQFAREPWYLLITAFSLGLGLWAAWLLRAERGGHGK